MTAIMYHVVGNEWREGEDLLSFDEQEARYGEPPAWKWECEYVDTDVVCLHLTLSGAVDYREEFCPGARILAVDVEGVHIVHVSEGYPAVLRMVEADRLAVLAI